MIDRAPGLAACAAILLTATLATAQAPAGQPSAGQAPAAPTNLQVLPKDIAQPQLLQTMQGIAQGLGVECNYCHVREGAGGRNDMAADDKPTKRTARQMLLLVRDINAKIPAAVGKPAEAATRVDCVTCHRGVAIPRQLADIMTETAGAQGMPAAIAKYRELRKQFYGTMAYDFTEGALVVLANRLGMAKPDDALQWLELNLEFNPKSARTHLAMAQIYNRKGDKATAIKSVEQALEIEPENANAKRMLQQLKGA